MKTARELALAWFVLATSPACRDGAEPATLVSPGIQGGYSIKPLERSVFDSPQVVIEAAGFNNWLIENYDSVDTESVKEHREHLYYLIDSRVKDIHSRDRVVWPQTDEGLLLILFSWSERLGVFGGHLVYNALRREDQPRLSPLVHVPEGFGLSLQGDVLVISSKHWSVAVPYYFMIWNIQSIDAEDGPATQLVALSTGAATHERRPGHSQATLMLLFGPGADGPAFRGFWAGRHGLPRDEWEAAASDRTRKTGRRYDESQDLHYECTAWSSEKGEFFVSYLGMSGPYEWNRPHYLDFLGAIRER